METQSFYQNNNANYVLLELERLLLVWLKSPFGPKQITKLTSVNKSPTVICAKAREYHDLVQRIQYYRNDTSSSDETSSNFIANREWYTLFQGKALKHNLKLYDFQKPIPNSITPQLNDLIISNEYTREQIWIGVHFGLNYKQMPIGTKFNLGKKKENKTRQHISLMLTGNISFDKDLMFQLKPLISHEGSANPRWVKDNFDEIVDFILMSDPKKARLTKSIMLKWIVEHFSAEVQQYYEANQISSHKTILLLSDAFRPYSLEQISPDWLKILFVSEGGEMHTGFVYDTKTTIIEPFIAKYLTNVYETIQNWSEIYERGIDELGENFSIADTIKSLKKLSHENFACHTTVWRAQICPCTNNLDNKSNLNGNFSYNIYSNKNQAIIDTIERAHLYGHKDVSLTTVIELIDRQIRELNDDKLIEVLEDVTSESSNNVSNSFIKSPGSDITNISTPIKIFESKSNKRRKIEIVNEEKKYKTKIKKEDNLVRLNALEKTKEHFEKEYSANIPFATREPYLQAFDKLIEFYTKKNEEYEHDLSFLTPKQSCISHFFQKNSSKPTKKSSQ